MLYAVAKNLQQGYLSPADFNTTINIAQNSYLDYLRGEYQKYQIRRPISVVEFGQNQMIRQSLAPLVYGVVLNPDTTTGIAAFPSDYEFNDAMWGLYGYYNIRFIQQDRQDSYLHSEIDPIATNPVYLIQHEGFHFFPENIGSARMSYIRTPPPITWGYDVDANGIPVYNATLSQQPVWADTDILQIVVRALAIIGVNLQFGAVMQYSEGIKQGGQ
jgi:hypothetical protein